jgi:hypothetical protein
MKRFLLIVCGLCLLFSAPALANEVENEVTTTAVEQDTAGIDSTVSHDKMLTRIGKEIQHKGSLLIRFIRAFNDFDTTYITPYKYQFCAMLMEKSNYEHFTIKSTQNNQSMSLSPNFTNKVGPYIGWSWLFLGYTYDIGKSGSSSNARRELDLSVYSSLIGFDFIWRKTGNDFYIRNIEGFDSKTYEAIPFSGININTFSINSYYIFNNKHFSYPAAFSQSTVQRKSCGSLIAGFTYSKHNMTFDYSDLPTDLSSQLVSDLRLNSLKYYSYSVNVGYAYNWVFAKNWLFCVSLTPAIGFKHNDITTYSENIATQSNTGITDKQPFYKMFKISNMNIDFLGRMSLVWNNTHYFGGIYVIAHTYTYRKEHFSFIDTFGSINAYIGLNFIRKKSQK